MVKLKIEFSIATLYAGSEVKEILEIEVEDYEDISEIEDEVDEYYKEWVQNKTDQSWKVVYQKSSYVTVGGET